jgi:hypothetical protein
MATAALRRIVLRIDKAGFGVDDIFCLEYRKDVVWRRDPIHDQPFGVQSEGKPVDIIDQAVFYEVCDNALDIRVGMFRIDKGAGQGRGMIIPFIHPKTV